MIRVGRCAYDKAGRRVDPPVPEGFVSVVVLMKSHSKWGVLGPYELRDARGRILENVWQFSKVYSSVPASRQVKSRYDSTVIWDHPAETHVDATTGALLPAYARWRTKGMHAPTAVRYPVGFSARHACLYSLTDTGVAAAGHPQLDYIQARKHIYAPMYQELVRAQPLFRELVAMVARGVNVLIVEVDGPHQESLAHYQATYGVDESFIQGSSMAATAENLDIMLNDALHPYGHGYCLARALLQEKEGSPSVTLG